MQVYNVTCSSPGPVEPQLSALGIIATDDCAVCYVTN